MLSQTNYYGEVAVRYHVSVTYTREAGKIKIAVGWTRVNDSIRLKRF